MLKQYKYLAVYFHFRFSVGLFIVHKHNTRRFHLFARQHTLQKSSLRHHVICYYGNARKAPGRWRGIQPRKTIIRLLTRSSWVLFFFFFRACARIRLCQWRHFFARNKDCRVCMMKRKPEIAIKFPQNIIFLTKHSRLQIYHFDERD